MMTFLLFFGMISVLVKYVGHALMFDGQSSSMPSADMQGLGAHRPHVVIEATPA
jgi:hypothetical protein